MELSGIRKARKKAGLTQNQLADILGISRATLSKYEGGQISPTIGQLSKIAMLDAFDQLQQLWVEGVADAAGNYGKELQMPVQILLEKR